MAGAAGDFDDAKLQEILKNTPGARLVRPGEHIDPAEIAAAQQPSPEEEAKQMEHGVRIMEKMRSDITEKGERVNHCETIKTQANEQFVKAETRSALKGYLLAIWLLKQGDPPVNKLLAGDKVPTGGDAIVCLGAGNGDQSATGSEVSWLADERVAPLRDALHVNAAAAFLKRSDWPAAAAACEFVLERDTQHSKALFRLAKAQEGNGMLVKAAATLDKLLKVPGQEDNRDARAMMDKLRKRSQKEKKMFGGMFERARKTDGDLYAEKDLRKERAEIRHRKANEPPQVTAKLRAVFRSPLCSHPTNHELVVPASP
jgi:tetratricopeptide (TPR) repeat protein